jgi:hypothetical protein
VIKLNGLSVLVHIPHEEKISWKRPNPRVGVTVSRKRDGVRKIDYHLEDYK